MELSDNEDDEDDESSRLPFDPLGTEDQLPPMSERLSCNTHFCYLCSSWLFESNPYSHFNDPKGSCYMRLWELEEGHDSGPGGPDWNLAAAQMQAEVDSDDDSEDLEQEIAAETGNNGQGANNYNWGRNQRPPPPAHAPPNAARFRAPPPAPVPPGAHANQQNGRRPDDAARAAAAERQLQVQAMAEARALQHNPPNALPPLRQMAGLQRFLELVQNDQEDEWDSDELDF
ncbi:conserved hypothetical protein [Histoplasma mississippiense (nom. inval.)]|uniref:conserved hypothetical protein n=1 Tax=Ajellomyces capsulatus (strain NAm1 / WU24) TaxID=2059318 RepID=UPI000157C6A0|nr:conserved hypothetical protein [Histoplasma mississippiense (nom. inval.)]EDN08628.1 conserved hypothetical protein [Histoplasma mississippiense (nom. inval.)]